MEYLQTSCYEGDENTQLLPFIHLKLPYGGDGNDQDEEVSDDARYTDPLTTVKQ
jgi:hypothetical protein